MTFRLIPVRRTSASTEGERFEGLFIHANVHTRTFHFPECAQYNSPQCRIEFKDVKVAREAGFHPCGFCATLLDQNRQ